MMRQMKIQLPQTVRQFVLQLLCGISLFCLTQLAVANPVLKQLDGKRIDFAALQGKWVFINYWATWCGPCLDEIQYLNRFAREQSGSVQLFGVNYDSLPAAEQKQLSKDYQLAYPSLAEDPSLDLNLGDIRGVPVTFVFNPQGKLVNKLRGGQTYKSLLAAIVP